MPFIVLPESSFVDITSTSKATTIRLCGSLLGGVLISRLFVRLATREGWVRSQNVALRLSCPTYFILVTAAMIVIVSLLSTALSIAPGISLWGRNPASFEAGEYTALMYVVIAIAAFVSVRESASIERVWAIVAISGIAVSSIGVFQYHGLAFLDIGQTHGTNTTGTAGNPIFYGALLVLMAPMSLAYIVRQYERASSRFNRYWLVALVLVTGSYTVSLATTVSRGPMLGWAVGLVIFGTVAAKYGTLRRAALPVSLIAVSIVAFAFLTTVYDPAPRITSTPETPDGASTEKQVDSADRKFGKLTHRASCACGFNIGNCPGR